MKHPTAKWSSPTIRMRWPISCLPYLQMMAATAPRRGALFLSAVAVLYVVTRLGKEVQCRTRQRQAKALQSIPLNDCVSSVEKLLMRGSVRRVHTHVAAQQQGNKTVKKQGSTTAAWQQHGSNAARQRGSVAACQQRSKAARQQCSNAARQLGSTAARE